MSEYGAMIDFLRENPYVTREEYMWKWTIPQIKIASVDFTHVRYLSDEDIKAKNNKVFGKSNKIELNDLGIPILGNKK